MTEKVPGVLCVILSAAKNRRTLRRPSLHRKSFKKRKAIHSNARIAIESRDG
jgi:hypothetical protein